jgi:protein-disulfide isomerase
MSSLGATALVGLALALASLFMWRVWTYYGRITSGKQVTLPQFSDRFTSSSKSAIASTGAHPETATDDDPSLGPKDAKLTIVEFLDYQCPFCGQESITLRETAAAYGDRVRFIIRDFPVQELHPDAVASAVAAGCAESQGKFWPMHDRLFAQRGVLTRADLDGAARQSGLDLPVFAACMDLQARTAEIQRDVADGLNAGVRGTPTFFFNGNKVEGVIPSDGFDKLIARFLSS